VKFKVTTRFRAHHNAWLMVEGWEEALASATRAWDEG
jgi:hypothetical protein